MNQKEVIEIIKEYEEEMWEEIKVILGIIFIFACILFCGFILGLTVSGIL